MGYLAERKQPHAVLIPYPLQGHINPLFKLAKLLHLRGFHITFVNTEYNHKRLLKSRGPKSLHGFPGFVFETIPDGLPSMDGDGDGEGDVSQDIPSLCDSIKKNFLHYFHELLARLNDSATDGLIPPVTCLVSDCFMSFTIQAAEELALPILLLYPASACSFLSVLHFRTLFEKGLIPLKDESYLTNGYLDTKVDWIPDSLMTESSTLQIQRRGYSGQYEFVIFVGIVTFDGILLCYAINLGAVSLFADSSLSVFSEVEFVMSSMYFTDLNE